MVVNFYIAVCIHNFSTSKTAKSYHLLTVVAIGITITQIKATATNAIMIFILQLRHHISRYT